MKTPERSGKKMVNTYGFTGLEEPKSFAKSKSKFGEVNSMMNFDARKKSEPKNPLKHYTNINDQKLNHTVLHNRPSYKSYNNTKPSLNITNDSKATHVIFFKLTTGF